LLSSQARTILKSSTKIHSFGGGANILGIFDADLGQA
jgi:hypothetical protein